MPGVLDQAKLWRLTTETRRRVESFLGSLEKHKVPYTLTSGWRSYADQSMIVTAYPKAKVGASAHHNGIAVDIAVPVEWRQAVGSHAAVHGLKWAGMTDPVHFEFAGPYSDCEIIQQYQAHVRAMPAGQARWAAQDALRRWAIDRGATGDDMYGTVQINGGTVGLFGGGGCHTSDIRWAWT